MGFIGVVPPVLLICGSWVRPPPGSLHSPRKSFSQVALPASRRSGLAAEPRALRGIRSYTPGKHLVLEDPRAGADPDGHAERHRPRLLRGRAAEQAAVGRRPRPAAAEVAVGRR